MNYSFFEKFFIVFGDNLLYTDRSGYNFRRRRAYFGTLPCFEIGRFPGQLPVTGTPVGMDTAEKMAGGRDRQDLKRW